MQKERRLSQQLINYWLSLGENLSDLPNEALISPEDIEDIWHNCFVIKQGVHNNIAAFRYSYVGKEITEGCIHSEPHIRHFLEEMLRLHESASIYAEKVLDENKPFEEEGSFSDPESKHQIIYRRCFLPLKSNDSGQPHTVLGGFRWKVEPLDGDK